MTEFRAWRPKLRTVLGVVVGIMLAAVGAVLVVVLQNVDATAEMRKEAREALLLAEMDTSVQRIAVAVDAWISGDLPVDTEGHPVLGRTDIQQERTVFDRAAAELGFIIKPEERFLVEDMERMLADYEAALVELDASGDTGLALLTAFHAGPQPIERAFREALLELQNEEIEHLAESTQAVKAAETKLRFLVPALLVLVVVLATGLRRLAINARHGEEAEALNKSRTAFIASISHELRTPLTTVVGLAQELRDGLASFSAEEVEEFASLIADESGEVAGIVEDLLVAARSDAGSLTILEETIDLRAEVDRVLEAENLLAGRVVKTAGHASARADGARVRQIIRNLLTNAARYGGQSIEIAIGGADGVATVRVSDDGGGIPEQDRERIFRPFERAHEVAGVPASVGLGLTVSRDLARAMAGNLRYDYDGRSHLELSLPATPATPLAA